ncbi:NmrA-like family domain-containing protein [Xylona heveae TC161]|uniref:NmrA-like family domain-containing protein n=1 Tax=Xylona heveae (strain CBS 132557 / TC161) TaxID=1328760 RepID=A0A165AC42_XYLHT|nr:NmrA-like family domain-containing protein [Xylona heveae TC161]KZF20236.1 NmrA-like family domain-containing protein [Xylona heveae TC161]
MAKILTVFGATGNQGGSVVRAVLEHPILSKSYKIRAVTRDPTKPNAKALSDKGAEVVKADLSDKASVVQAVKGSHAVFGVTNFWENPPSKQREYTQGKHIADASKETGVEHLIWSTLPHASTLTGGKLSGVTHFDSKAEVAEYIEQQGIPATFYLPACFMSNITGSLQKTGAGYSLNYPFTPTTVIPCIDVVADTGKFVAAALANPSAFIGKKILGVTGWYTPNDIKAAFEEATGKQLEYNEISVETFRSFLPDFMAEELGENFLLIKDYQYYGPGTEKKIGESLKVLQEVGESPTGLKEFFSQAKLP